MAASSVVNDDDSTYLEPHENSPENKDNTLYQSTITEEVENIHVVLIIELADNNTPRAIFTLVHKLNTTELGGGGATPAKTLLDDGETLTLHTQLASQSLPSVYAPDALDSPPLPLRKDSNDDARIAKEENLPGDRLTAANDKLFGIYQDWVHQNIGTHLDGGIEDSERPDS